MPVTHISSGRLAVGQLLTAQMLLGTMGVFLLEAGVPSHQAVFWRCLFGAAFLTLYCAFAGHFREAIWTRRALMLCLLGGTCMVLNWVLFFEAIRLTWIGFATITYHIQPFWIVLAGIFVAKEKTSVTQLCWVALAFAGFLLALNIGQPIEGENQLLLGAGLAVLAGLFYTVTLFATRAIGKTIKPHLVAWVHTLMGIVLLGPLVSAAQLPETISGWSWLVGLGVIHTGLVYMLQYDALPKLSSALVAVLIFVYPASALIVDLAVYGHGLDLFQCLGLLLIATGSLGVGGALKRKRIA